MEVEIALRNHDIPHKFPSAVEKYVKKFTEEVPEEAKKGRVDLRNLPLVTIDGEDARDFDDAVYCEKHGKGWKLWGRDCGCQLLRTFTFCFGCRST